MKTKLIYGRRWQWLMADVAAEFPRAADWDLILNPYLSVTDHRLGVIGADVDTEENRRTIEAMEFSLQTREAEMIVSRNRKSA